MNVSKPVEIVATDAQSGTIAVQISLSSSNRTIERSLRRVLKPFKICPKHPQVKKAVELIVNDPALSPAEASRRVCNTTKLERRIRYWSDKATRVIGESL